VETIVLADDLYEARRRTGSNRLCVFEGSRRFFVPSWVKVKGDRVAVSLRVTGHDATLLHSGQLDLYPRIPGTNEPALADLYLFDGSRVVNVEVQRIGTEVDPAKSGGLVFWCVGRIKDKGGNGT